MTRLQNSDDYILVMAERVLPREHMIRDLILYVAIGLALVGLVMALALWGRCVGLPRGAISFLEVKYRNGS